MPKKTKQTFSSDDVIAFLKTTRGLLVTAAVLAITPLQVVSFILLLIVATRLLPLGSLGVITRSLLSLLLSMCVVTFVAVGAWAIGVPINAPIILLVLVFLLSLLMLWQRRNGTAELRSWRTDRYELSAAGLALAAMIFIAIPVLQQPNAAEILRVISAGGDNSSHIDMVKTSDLNQGIAYGTHNRVNPPGSAINYPQGWHFNVAFYKWMSDPLVHYEGKIGDFLLLFYSVSVLWFGMLVFFITRLALRLGQIVVAKPHPAAIIGTIAVVGGVAIHWLLQLFTHGFQAQTAALTLLIATTLMIAEAYAVPAAKRYALLIIAALLAVGCNFVWVFIMPITCGAVGVAVLATAISLKKLPSWPTIAAFAILFAIAFVQPLFYLLFPVQFEFPMILQRGDINATSMLALLTILCIAVVYCALRWRAIAFRAVLCIAAAALLFAFWLMVYQLMELGELRYFYYKSTYTFIVIGAALMGAIMFDLASQAITVARLKRSGIILLCILGLITSGLVWWQIQDPKAAVYTDRSLGGMSGPQALAVVTQITKGPEVSADTVFIGSCNRGDDIRASLFVAALTFKPIIRADGFDPGAHEETKVFATIKQAMLEKARRITVIPSDQVVTEHLRAYLGEEEFAKLTIMQLDLTPETEPIKQCPDRIRDTKQFPVQ